MSKPPSDEDRALAAYAEPIEKNAVEWACGVLDSIECDLAHGVSKSFAEEVKAVKASEEWPGALASLSTAPPLGALPWARRLWCNAFYAALQEQAARRAEQHRARGERLIAEYLHGERP